MRHARILRTTLAVVLVLAGALALTGCDSNDDEDDSDFAVFARGSWRITEFTVEGSDFELELDARYDSQVVFSFSENNDTGERNFSLYGRVDGENGLDQEGDIQIDGDSDEILFLPETGARAFELNYELKGSSIISLFTDGGGSLDGRIIRDLLLPSSGLGGDDPEVRLTIERAPQPQNGQAP